MKVNIDYEEWFPVYCVNKDKSGKFEATEIQVANWERVFNEFAAVQQELEALHGKRNEH